MYTIQDIYTSDQNNYELPLYYRKNAWLVAPRVQNFTGNPGTGAGEWNIGTGGSPSSHLPGFTDRSH